MQLVDTSEADVRELRGRQKSQDFIIVFFLFSPTEVSNRIKLTCTEKEEGTRIPVGEPTGPCGL